MNKIQGKEENVMKKNKEYYLNLPYKMVMVKMPNDEIYGGQYEAHYVEYPTVIGVGKTRIEAISSLDEAFGCMIEDLLSVGDDIIEPIVEDTKKRVNILISEKVLAAIAKISSNRSFFLEKAAQHIINNKITL